MAAVVAEGSACGDCVIVIANDDTSGMTDERATEVRAGIARTSSDGSNVVVACQEDEGTCEDFSSRPCDVCGTSLAGDRHPVVWLR